MVAMRADSATDALNVATRLPSAGVIDPMKLTPWFLAAIAPIAVAGCSGTLLGHFAVLAVTLGIFVGTLSLGRHTVETAPATGLVALAEQSEPAALPALLRALLLRRVAELHDRLQPRHADAHHRVGQHAAGVRPGIHVRAAEHDRAVRGADGPAHGGPAPREGDRARRVLRHCGIGSWE